MALGPDSIREKAEQRAKAAEAKIDDAIRASFGGCVTIGAKSLGINYHDWRSILQAKYLAAGWQTVEWRFDPRDGDFIELQP